MASHSQKPRGFAGAWQGLNNLLSLAACIFLAPRLWPLVDAPLWAALIPLYSPEIVYWLHVAGWLATWPVTFFAARLVLSALFGFAAMIIARRMM